MAEATDERTDLIRSLDPSSEDASSEGIRETPGKLAAREVADAPKPEEVDAEERQNALEWLLSDESDADAAGHESYEVDVAPPGKPSLWVTWVVRPLNAEELRAARQMAQRSGRNRQQRRAGTQITAEDTDVAEVNLRILTMATVDPDLIKAAETKGVADPAFVLKHRFRFKPGLIDQLASKVLTISGYEEEAIRDPIEIRAAGN
jgi:hypothetical protein